MNVEVKPAYKLTEAGMIPEHWSSPCLGLLVHSVEYGSSAKSSLAGKTPVLRMGNLQDGKIDWNDLVYTDDDQEISKYLLNSGDVLFNRTNTPELVGKTSIYRGETPAIFAGYLIRIKERKDLLNSAYLNYVLNSEPSKKYSQKVLSVAVGQANINGQKLKTYPIPLPPLLVEQEAISSALMDADALISGLDQLIAKKRDIKQAAMQKLLTGHHRLPGFRGEWVVKPIGESIDLLSGFPFPSASYSNSGVRLLRGSNVKRGQTDWSEEITQFWPSINQEIAKYEVNVGDLVISMDGSLVGRSYARIVEADLPALLLQRVARIRSRTIDIGFLAQFIGSQFFTTHCDSVKTVTAIPHISADDIRSFSIPTPPTIEEQTAIATILSDMDNELTGLESRRDKARQIKQGMMQELLTGKTRIS